jgi:hypothetical protein
MAIQQLQRMKEKQKEWESILLNPHFPSRKALFVNFPGKQRKNYSPIIYQPRDKAIQNL